MNNAPHWATRPVVLPPPSQGGVRATDGTCLWRVWAPFSDCVQLVTWPEGEASRAVPMEPEGFGHFIHRGTNVPEGLRYAYRLESGAERPDPASRWQPEGIHRPSAVFTPAGFEWTDHSWKGVPREELVIYELHVGTFTPEGTFDAIVPRLPQLVELGVTAIELLPVAEFPGTRNWGYDGVHPFAVQHSYGGPQGLQRLVDAAHHAGLAVLLDVVYNHLGPEGNYLGEFGPYFTNRYQTPWGSALNFDGADSDPVRQFFLDNAQYWIREFHLDGLRLDSIHRIYDLGVKHLLIELQEQVQQIAAAQQRVVHVIAESDQNDVRLVQPRAQGGFELDGVWNNGFHRSIHAVLTGECGGYYQDFGSPAQIAKSFNDVFAFDGIYSPARRRRHGTRVGDTDRSHFVVYVQNHDLVGNRPLSDRYGTLLSPEAQRLACGLLLVSPFVPLIFMGEEYGETRQYPFFCEFAHPGLNEAVRRGRIEELRFPEGTDILSPDDPATFASAILTWDWPDGTPHAGLRRLYRDLLQARRRWPALRDLQHTRARIIELENPSSDPSLIEAIPADSLLLIERGSVDPLLVVANLSPKRQLLPAVVVEEIGPRGLWLTTAATRYSEHPDEAVAPGECGPYEQRIFGTGSPPGTEESHSGTPAGKHS